MAHLNPPFHLLRGLSLFRAVARETDQRAARFEPQGYDRARDRLSVLVHDPAQQVLGSGRGRRRERRRQRKSCAKRSCRHLGGPASVSERIHPGSEPRGKPCHVSPVRSQYRLRVFPRLSAATLFYFSPRERPRHNRYGACSKGALSTYKRRSSILDHVENCALRFTRRTLLTQRNAVSVRTFFSRQDRDEILARMRVLTPEHAARWGSLNAPEPHRTGPLRHVRPGRFHHRSRTAESKNG